MTQTNFLNSKFYFTTIKINHLPTEWAEYSEKGSETTWVNVIFDRGMEHLQINNVAHKKRKFPKNFL